MNKSRKRRFLKYGIYVRGSLVWLSELTSIIFVLALVGLLGCITLIIIYNNSKISSQSARISSLKAQQLSVQRRIENAREKERILRGTAEVLGKAVPPATLYQVVDLVHQNSKAYGYDPLLVLAVIHVESRFKSDALGKYRDGTLSGAMGLMQLKFETAREVARDLGMELASEDDLFRPETNLVLGLGYLTRMIAKFRSFKLGLLAYNQGPGVIEGNLTGNTELSIRYYNKVLRSYFLLKRMVEEAK
jgi:soluble lytic murein transglycosylase-like protein